MDSGIALSLGGCRNFSSSRPDLDDRRRVVAEYVSRTQRAERPRPGPAGSTSDQIGGEDDYARGAGSASAD